MGKQSARSIETTDFGEQAKATDIYIYIIQLNIIIIIIIVTDVPSTCFDSYKVIIKAKSTANSFKYVRV